MSAESSGYGLLKEVEHEYYLVCPQCNHLNEFDDEDFVPTEQTGLDKLSCNGENCHMIFVISQSKMPKNILDAYKMLAQYWHNMCDEYAEINTNIEVRTHQLMHQYTEANNRVGYANSIVYVAEKYIQDCINFLDMDNVNDAKHELKEFSSFITKERKKLIITPADQNQEAEAQ